MKNRFQVIEMSGARRGRATIPPDLISYLAADQAVRIAGTGMYRDRFG
jgi:hypothetical protein